MPLKIGGSQRTLSENIAELMKSYHRKGMIGTSTPKSNEAAQKQAIAISFSKRRKGK